MKKKLLLVLVILFINLSTNITYSQVSKSIVDTAKQWNVLQTYPNTQELKKYTHLYRITSEDTLINNKVFLRLQKVSYYDTSSYANWENHDWIREDSNRVYIFTYSHTTCNNIHYFPPREYLFLDFNLSINDTFHITYEENEAYSDPLVVTFIDSVEIENQYCKRILFNEIYPQYTELGTYWIEGIGSNRDFVNHYDHLHSSWNLLCTYKNNNLIYDAGFGYCYIYQGLDEIEQGENSIKLYPTLVKDKINITTTQQHYNINVYDIFGRIVFTKNNIYLNHLLNLGFLNNGTYLIVIKNRDNKTLKTEKIIKTN